MSSKYLALFTILAAATLAGVGALLISGNTVSAQSGTPAPTNVQVENGERQGQAVVSWDPASGASGYQVAWLNSDDAWVEHEAGRSWLGIVESQEANGGDASSSTISNLTPGGPYASRVGAVTGSGSDPAWSEWATINLAGGSQPAAAPAPSVNADLIAAALALSKHANEAGNVGSAPTTVEMNRASIVRDVAALTSIKAAVDAQLAGLHGQGYEDRVDYIESLVDQLVSNIGMIQRGRPQILRELADSTASRRDLTQRNSGILFPGINTILDDQFYHMMTSFPEVGSVGESNISSDDVLRYTHLADLSASAALAHTFLTIASLSQNPDYVARTRESYDSTAGRIERHIEYLSDGDVPEAERTIIDLSQQMLRDASGDNNFFDSLVHRLELIQAERKLIETNEEILSQLQDQIVALVAESQGLDAPAIPSHTAGPSMDSGISAGQILFGQSAALTGPSSALGEGMKTGIEAAFKEANDAGGVHGRQLVLKAMDDRYDSDVAFGTTISLIQNDGVFGLIGAVGTPTSRAANPIASAEGVPFVAPFTGAQFLRGDDQTNVLNYRASYYQETEKIVDLLADAGVTRVSVLYQNDSFGTDGLIGVQNALASRDQMELVSSWHYLRNTNAVKGATLRIVEGDPEAVIFIGAYEPVATSIELVREHLGDGTIFVTVSFVGSNALAAELGDAGQGVYVTQVVPLPSDDTIAVVSNYQSALAAHDPDAVPGFISLEGYLAGRLAIAQLQACGAEVSRQCFLDAVSGSTTIDIDGLQLQYGPGDNQGSDDVFLTVIGPDGNFMQVDSIGAAP